MNEETINGEVVEVYRRPDPREVVEVYTRPLPGAAAQEQPCKQKTPQKRRRGKYILIGIGVCCAAALAAAAAVFLLGWLRGGAEDAGDPFEWYYGEEADAEPSGEVTISSYPTGQGILVTVAQEHGETLTAQEIYRRVNPSVVQVSVQAGSQLSLGTGVIFTRDGYILTNYHVVEGGSLCYITLDSGAGYPASYVAGDPDSDLAVLKVDGEDLPAVEFGESDFLEVGDTVYAIGNPLGYELWGTMTDGIVSAVDREVRVDERTMTLIQTNAALNSGNSGGPLINAYGQVVGLNVIKMSSKYSNVEGLGFAIPTATMERVVDDLLTCGTVQPQPLLGLSVLVKADTLPDGSSGLRVEDVTAGGAADRAGIQPGDYVLAAEGCAMGSSKDLLRVRRNKRLGQEMTVTIWRDGTVTDVTLSLQESVE